MTTIDIYHFEDDPNKRVWLKPIIDGLNQRGIEDKINFVDKLGPSWDELTKDPRFLVQAVWEAVRNENAVCLVDILLQSTDPNPAVHPFNSAAEILARQLEGDGLQDVVDESRPLLEDLKGSRRTEDVSFAAIVLALFRHYSVRFACASSNARVELQSVTAEYTEHVFSFPQGFGTRPDQRAIQIAIDTIYDLAVAATWLDSNQFIEKIVELGHPTSKQQKKAAGELLRHFLRMSGQEFAAEFATDDGELQRNTLEALKSIAGVRPGLDLKAAWLLAYGVHRTSFSRKPPQGLWDAGVFREYPHNKEYLIARAVDDTKNPESRTIWINGLKSYVELCNRLFVHDSMKDADNLRKVNLEATRLLFGVDIPFPECKSALLDVFRKARGEDIEGGNRAHDTSTAVLRFLVSSFFRADGDNVIVCPHAPIKVSKGDMGINVSFG